MGLLRQCLDEIRALQLERTAIEADTRIPTARSQYFFQKQRAAYPSTISDKLGRNQQAQFNLGTKHFPIDCRADSSVRMRLALM